MAQLFGKNYQETGKSSAPLLLRSNGEIKVQWGNKFIDLIKNGKINSSSSSDLIKSVASTDEMSSTGIYYNTSDETVYISIDGTTKQLSSSEESYVSFLKTQELTNDQKTQALTNIGFQYDTLDTLNTAGIDTGIAYVKETNKLYLITSGNVAEYQMTLPSTYTDLTIGEISISKTTIQSNQLQLNVGGETYVQLADSSILLNKTLIANTIQSSNYISNNYGFAIEDRNGKYTLEIDSIDWRNISTELPRNQKDYVDYTIIGDYNVVESATFNGDYCILSLRYTNALKAGDYILVEVNTTTDGEITSTEPIEFQIEESSETQITIESNLSDLTSNSQYKIYQSRVPQFIQGKGYLALRKWDSDNNTYVYHTVMGSYSEKKFGISKDETIKFGFYSDDIKVTGISLSGAKFSGSLPEYTETTPNTVTDSQIPTMCIVNSAIKAATDSSDKANQTLINNMALPVGSIIMFNSADNIPDGWHICDGSDSTPNLIDKFIKAGATLGESTVTLTKYQESVDSSDDSTEAQDETNKYELNAYSLIFIMKMK